MHCENLKSLKSRKNSIQSFLLKYRMDLPAFGFIVRNCSKLVYIFNREFT